MTRGEAGALDHYNCVGHRYGTAPGEKYGHVKHEPEKKRRETRAKNETKIDGETQLILLTAAPTRGVAHT